MSHLICKCFATLFSFHVYCYVSDVLYKSERKKLQAIGIQTFEECEVFWIFNVYWFNYGVYFHIQVTVHRDVFL